MTGRFSVCLAFAFSLVPTGAIAHDDAALKQEKLGQVSFSVSCSAEAQRRFHRAMALYHSFYWSEAQKAFRSVLAADPDCAMAQWGLALNALENPFAWPGIPRMAEAAGELAKAKAMGAKTQRERDYIAALDAFFRDADKLPHKVRHDAFERAMAQVAQTYPHDTEAQVLYALVLTANYDPTDKKYTKQLAAARILEPIFVKLPEHPGVAH